MRKLTLPICVLAVILLCNSDTSFAMRINDNIHNQFIAISNDYYESDRQLNETWSILKAGLSQYEYDNLLRDQREWVNNIRDIKASNLIERGRRPVDAYTLVTRERIGNLKNRYPHLFRPTTEYLPPKVEKEPVRESAPNKEKIVIDAYSD